MRTLTAAVDTAVGLTATAPGYLVEIDFTLPARFSTRGQVNWNGQDWVGYDLRIAGLELDGSASSQSGTITFGNADLTMSAYLLGEGIAGRRIRVWAIYGETPDSSDPVLVFDGVGDGANIDDQGRASVTVLQVARTTFCPRTYMTAAAGFSFLPPLGKVYNWQGQTIRLTEEGY